MNIVELNSATGFPMREAPLRYVLVTPARNEADFIEECLKSVTSQTVPPLRWVIVSDGSTDGTDEIVARHADLHCWIELVRMPERSERHFAGKVHAFNAGYSKLKDLRFDIIGSLDADISFDETYFAFLLNKFHENPRLGVAGTPFREGEETYDYRFTSIEHVSGACQLFRRECFEDIGGYIPLRVGGIDLVAVTTARMKGWETRSFTEKVSLHHKKTQSGKHSSLRNTFKSGYHDYLMGSHPVWQVFRSLYQMKKSPALLGGSALLTGFFWAMITFAQRPLSRDLVAFRRTEQMHRLKRFLRESLGSERRIGNSGFTCIP
jgi:poly-beta-1,6-N-acetyl-D-glucosamine synthase